MDTECLPLYEESVQSVQKQVKGSVQTQVKAGLQSVQMGTKCCIESVQMGFKSSVHVVMTGCIECSNGIEVESSNGNEGLYRVFNWEWRPVCKVFTWE